MKILLDMNLSPLWVADLRDAGFEALHWSAIGEASAPDTEIFQYARQHGYVVFTHDLDFGAILASTQADSPSVIQIRAQNILPGQQSSRLISVLRRHGEALEAGAIIVVDERRERVRILPLRGNR